MTSNFPPETENGSSKGSQSQQPTSDAAPSAQLASLKIRLQQSLRQFPDFPEKGILFEDICPIFRDHARLTDLIDALVLFTAKENGGPGKPDLIVGLDARGFLIGPPLALRLGAGFVPVRKKGKLPGLTETATYKKEYGEDVFEIQADAIAAGQKVFVLDDIIATGEQSRYIDLCHALLISIPGGSAAAAGSLVRKLGGDLLGYVFLLELDFLKGRQKLDAPAWTLLSGQKDAR